MFLTIFGKPNQEKGGRLSWSGEPCPKINKFNSFGQKLIVDDENNILAIYSYSEDQRKNKHIIVPEEMKKENLTLAKWEINSIQQQLERKFNQYGWFKCSADKDGVYNEIAFGKPINYENWIADVKRGLIFFDSGMYAGNNRPYSQWRANNSYWENLIVSRY